MTTKRNAQTEPEPMELELRDLCEMTGVTVRTVRYYIQQGLLPSPGQGPNARYGATHLARLRWIRKMQNDHLPLSEIRRRLASMDEDLIASILQSDAPPPAPSSAVDYVRSILGGSDPVAPSSSISKPAPVERSQWERIALAPDVELHLRRPLSRLDNKRVEKLIELSRDLFRDE